MSIVVDQYHYGNEAMCKFLQTNNGPDIPQSANSFDGGY